ncbi:MAG: pyrDII [Frankiales bacterium]|nr:pyrDII [Frankiales bacterium]
MMLQPLAAEIPSRILPVCIDAPVLGNQYVSDRYWMLRLDAPEIATGVRPGQFVLLTPSQTPGEGPSLPRPMAVYDVDRADGAIDILYGVVGSGTTQLTRFRPGDRMTAVGPLGRPFEPPSDATRLLVVGRGIGICSLTLLARERAERGHAVTVLLSGRHRGAIIGADFCDAVGVHARQLCDEDGSSDVESIRRLLVEQYDPAPPDFVATCGSKRLLALCRDLGRRWTCEVQVSVEAHMACGLGYCHGCAAGEVGRDEESPLVCATGPVFRVS